MNAPRCRALSSFSFILLALALPSTAFAQTAPAAPASAAPAPSSAPPASASAPAASSAAPAATDPAAPASPAAPAGADAQAAPEVFPRFRWGISGIGGPLVGTASGGVGGVETRFGAQINRMFGVYGQPFAIIGAGTGSKAGAASGTGVVAAGVGVLADVTFLDMFFIAAGPELVGGAVASGSSTSASGTSGVFFSVAARAGIALGSVKPDKRQAFTINFDFRSVFTPGDPLIIPALALGYDAF